MKIRWDAGTYSGNNQVNVAVTLFSTGKIRFDYGSGNTLLGSPTVGISAGDGTHYTLLNGYNGQATLTNANSVELNPTIPTSYAETPGSGNLFYTSGGGIAQNWHGDDTYFSYTLPFTFSFFGTNYTSVQVSTNGFLQFSGPNYAGDADQHTDRVPKQRPHRPAVGRSADRPDPATTSSSIRRWRIR